MEIPRCAFATLALALAPVFAMSTGCATEVELLRPVDARAPEDTAHPLDAARTPDAREPADGDAVVTRVEAGATDVARDADTPVRDAETGTNATVPGAMQCPARPCPAGHDCCLLDGTCFDPVTGSVACPRPTITWPSGHPPCAANSQCADDQYCAAGDCLGAGSCEALANCAVCWPSCDICACDGHTYHGNNVCGLRLRVVRYGTVACGTSHVVADDAGATRGMPTGCASDSQCPAGQSCCARYGNCIDLSVCPTCCDPPDGLGNDPCASDADCTSDRYCAHAGCTGPGYCTRIPSAGDCDGEFDPVCGCNGHTYANRRCAAVVATNVAHTGTCP